MSPRDRKGRKGGGSQRRTLSMAEFQTALVNMPPAQRSALFRMFPERAEATKLPEKVTLRQLDQLWVGLEAFMDTQGRAVEFSYAIIQNRLKLGPAIKELELAREPPDAWKAFDAERLKVCAEFANKDAQGNAVHDGERYAIPDEKREAFDARAAEVREQYAEAIAVYKALADVYEKMLDEERPCPKFVLIPMRALPPNLTARQLEPLQIILE